MGEGEIDVAMKAHVMHLSQVFVHTRLTYLKKVLQQVHQNGSLVESWTAKTLVFFSPVYESNTECSWGFSEWHSKNWLPPSTAQTLNALLLSKWHGTFRTTLATFSHCTHHAHAALKNTNLWTSSATVVYGENSATTSLSLGIRIYSTCIVCICV